MPPMKLLPEVLTVLDQALQLEGRASTFDAHTPLLGALPELDSMTAVALIGALEVHFGIQFNDHDLQATAFETVGSLCELIEQTLG